MTCKPAFILSVADESDCAILSVRRENKTNCIVFLRLSLTDAVCLKSRLGVRGRLSGGGSQVDLTKSEEALWARVDNSETYKRM